MSVKVFNTKVLIEDTSLLYVSFRIRDRLFTWSSEPLEGLAVCRTREVPSFLPSALQSSAVPTEVILPRLNNLIFPMFIECPRNACNHE